MKLTGLLLIVLLSTALGASFYDRDRRKVRILFTISSFIDEIYSGIRYTGSTVEEMLISCADNFSYKELLFLKYIKDDIKNRSLCADTVRNGILSSATQMNLSQEEIVPLLTIADKLGTTDVQGQLSMLETCKTQILEIKSRQTRKCETLGKLYISLGLLLGLGTAVILA